MRPSTYSWRTKGLPTAGKTTVTEAPHRRLSSAGLSASCVLNGDILSHGSQHRCTDVIVVAQTD